MSISVLKDFFYKHRRLFCAVFLFILPIALYLPEIISDKLIYSGDGLIALSKSVFEKNTILSGQIPFWNNSVMLGTPYLADPGNALFYPLKLLSFIMGPVLYSKIFFVVSLGLGGIFMYLFIKEATKKDFVAVVAAVIFLTSSFIGGCRKEHIMVYSTIIWLPLILFFILRYFSCSKRKCLIFAAVAMAVQFFAGFPQVCIYSYIFVFLFLIYMCTVHRKGIRSIFADVLFLGAFLIAFTAIQLLPSIDMIARSGRNSSDIFGLLSTHPGIGIMSLFPYIFGDIYYPFGLASSAEISIELYIGIIPLVYALYTFRYHFKDKLPRFFAIASILAFLYSSCMHIPFLAEIIKSIPVLNMFGMQSRMLFITIFSGLFCSAWGLRDLTDREGIKRLLRFSIMVTVFIIVLAAVIMAVSLSPIATGLYRYLRDGWFSIFGVSILIAAGNALLIGIFAVVQKYGRRIVKPMPYIVMALLCLVTVKDVWRFSGVYNTEDYQGITNTEEILALSGLPDIKNSRVSTIYDFAADYYGSTYQQSGLIDSRNMLTGIHNINGWMEFEDQRANELLDKIESRDSSGVTQLISQGNDVLSMLAVRYILCPKGNEMPPKVPDAEESTLASDNKEFVIPGNEQLSVYSYPISVMNNRYYKIEFKIDAPEGAEPDTFYVDLYGGVNYDRNDLQRDIAIKTGSHTYCTYLYTGDASLPEEPVYARIVCVSSVNLTASNVNISLMEESSLMPEYKEVAKTERYTIYENTNARDMLYISDKVEGIKNSDELIKYPYLYPDMDKTSYVEGLDGLNINSDGEISNLTVETNSVEAQINSEHGAFVNNSQSFQNGWRAYLDGQEVNIYRVNGVIQGIEVPSGQHIVKFIYYPPLFNIGILITAIGIVLAILYGLNQRYGFIKLIKSKIKKQEIKEDNRSDIQK